VLAPKRLRTSPAPPPSRKSLRHNDLRRAATANAVPKIFLKILLDTADNYGRISAKEKTMVAMNNGLDTALTIPCVLCSQEYVVFVNAEDVNAWLSGSGLIQDVMSYLSANDREMLISRICPKCWDETFA